jgi:ABC-2 type transport system ATP-binding protein
MPPLLLISDFRKKYPSGFQFSLDPLELHSGIHLIQGENGSGKSTFLKALAGIHDAEGEIDLGGISLRKSPLGYRKKIGYAEAEPVFPEFLNTDDLIQVVAASKNAEKLQIEMLKERFGVQKFSGYPVGTYSSGMLKKTALLLAFLGNPSLIILDEPFTTIDVASQEILTALILDQSKSGVSFLLTSHQSNPMNHLPFTSKLVVDQGRLISHE